MLAYDGAFFRETLLQRTAKQQPCVFVLRKKMNQKCVGIWADRKNAFVVTFTGKTDHVLQLESRLEGRLKVTGGWRSQTPYGPQDVTSETKAEERWKHALSGYCNDIVAAIREADKILIIGPGDTKRALEKQIKKSKNLASKIVGVEPCGKMTKNRLVAKFRHYFGLARQRGGSITDTKRDR